MMKKVFLLLINKVEDSGDASNSSAQAAAENYSPHDKGEKVVYFTGLHL